MATIQLMTEVQVRSAANGYIAIYKSLEYVFTNIKDLNVWMTTISQGG